MKTKDIIIIILLIIAIIFSIINTISIKELKERTTHTDNLITELHEMVIDSNDLYEEAKKAAEQSRSFY